MSKVDFIFTAPKQHWFKNAMTGGHIPWAEKQRLKQALRDEGFDTVSFVKKKPKSNEFTVAVTHTKDDSAFATCVERIKNKLTGYKTATYSEEDIASALSAKIADGNFVSVTGMFGDKAGGIQIVQ